MAFAFCWPVAPSACKSVRTSDSGLSPSGLSPGISVPGWKSRARRKRFISRPTGVLLLKMLLIAFTLGRAESDEMVGYIQIES